MSLSSLLIRRSLPLTVGVVAAIVAVAIAFGALGPDSKPKPVQPPSLSIAERIPLDTVDPGPGMTIATDGNWPGDNTPVWFIRGEGPEGIAERLDFSDARPRSKEFPVDLSSASSRRVLDIGEWSTGTVIFDMQLERGGVRARVLSLDRRGSVEASGFARLSRPLVKREVAVATWSGTLPDLFIIDSGGARERVRITVFSGESGFSETIAWEYAPLRKLDPDEWAFDVGRLVGRRPSLVAFTRSGTGSDGPEIHALSGDSRFRQFIVHRRVDPRAVDGQRSTAAPRFAAGVTLGRPSVLLVEGRRLLTLPFSGPR